MAHDKGEKTRGHIPVLAKEAIEAFDPKPGQIFIDGTVGQGGHAKIILEHVVPGGRLFAIDRDPENLVIAKEWLRAYENETFFIQDSYLHFKKHVQAQGISQVDGILLDLGFSSAHVDNPERGFSFQKEGPLDMRYDPKQSLTAKDILATWTKQELIELFEGYGEETQAQKIVEAIKKHQKIEPIETTTQLADLISSVIPFRGKRHPATQVFQALRIAVNDELGQLTQVLPDLVEMLRPGGRLAIITFHSLEDRIVKQFFKEHHGKELHLVNKHVIKPSFQEIKQNPRARSAKLRVIERIKSIL